MRKYIFIITAIIISSCNNAKKEEIVNTKVVKKELKPFFDSDKIDHYYLNFSEDDFTKFTAKDLKSRKDKEFASLFMGFFPELIPVKDFETTLLKFNYKKSNLSFKQEKEIEKIFSDKDSLQNSGYACVAEYRDIFLFRKDKKTIGVAKVCFKCGRFDIIGSKLDTSGFGLWSELDKLKSIVRPN